jgi:uncharacterized repeat protein (TIGR01451 family)
VSAPTLAKSFGAASIQKGSSTSLTFTVTNPNASTSLVNVGFTDPLPAGLHVANPNGATGTCLSNLGAAVTALPGTGTITVSDIVMPGGSNCTVAVDVVGTAAGVQNNVTDHVSGSYDDGSGDYTLVNGNTASDSVTVIGPPVLTKSFAVKSIPVGGTAGLTFSIDNPNPGTSLTAIGFTDTLPAGLVVATPSGLSGSCGGGTITADAGTQTISLSGASLNASAMCTFSLGVTGTAKEYNTTQQRRSARPGGERGRRRRRPCSSDFRLQ